MEEVWKEIPGYEGSYQVSNLGRIRSCDRFVDRYCYKAKTLKKYPYHSKILKQNNKGFGGYPSVGLCINGTHKSFYVHRLVALAFINNDLNKPQINHKDGNKSNTHASNLEWVTDKENKHHCRINNLQKIARGNDFKNAKLDPIKISKIIELRKSGLSTYKIAKYFGNITPSCVSAILRGEKWKHLNQVRDYCSEFLGGYIPDPESQLKMEL